MQSAREILRTPWVVWAAFAVLFIGVHAVDPWSIIPQFPGWHSTGFPLVFFQYQDGAGYVIFNLLFLVADLAFWYFAARAIVFAFRQLTKYGFPRQR